MIKGLNALQKSQAQINLRIGFTKLLHQHPRNQVFASLETDLCKIEVEQVLFCLSFKDIKLKTLYFFKWCKFIEYGKSIKKLRLKQIDDLRKSLTFNLYAVKFSYFHNWRRFSKKNAQNRSKFETIQFRNKKYTFSKSLNSFYQLFGNFLILFEEIKQIQSKLAQKVLATLAQCYKKRVFKKIALNNAIQKKKLVRSMNEKLNAKDTNYTKDNQVKKIKHRFMNYLIQKFSLESIKSKTLSENFIISNNQYNKLCKRTALQSLKNDLAQLKEKSTKIIKFRKYSFLKQKYIYLEDKKKSSLSKQNLQKFIKFNRLKKSLKYISFYSKIVKNFESINNIQKPLSSNQELICKSQLSIQSQQNISSILKKEQKIILDSELQRLDLYKLIQFNYLKQNLTKSIKQNVRIKGFKNLRSYVQRIKNQRINLSQIKKLLQNKIFDGLEKNSKRIQIKNNQIMALNKLYQTNLQRKVFNSLKFYKFIKISHQQCLEALHKKIFEPRQLLKAFQNIRERSCQISACESIFFKIQKISIKHIFNHCFSNYIQTLGKVKNMQKICYLKKLQSLFNLLKQNQKHNLEKTEQIKQSAILKLQKQFLLKNLREQNEFNSKFSNVYYFWISQRQKSLLNSLKQRKFCNQEFLQKSQKLDKYLGLSLFKSKFTFLHGKSIEFQQKQQSLLNFIYRSQFSVFKKCLNQIKISRKQFQQKKEQLQKIIVKRNLCQLISSIQYERNHKKQTISKKINKINLQVNFRPFLNKFDFQAKNLYLKRWVEWKKKMNVFLKIQHQKYFNQHSHTLIQSLKRGQISNAWRKFTLNICIQREILEEKQNQVMNCVNKNRKQTLQLVAQKLKNVKEVSQSQDQLSNLIKMKYFSKFMRNSLVNKFEKVKEYCAIKSYAKKLKSKTFKGLRIMLMRLRDKQNQLRTQHQIIVKVDKALYHSRKSHKLSETIQRFNVSRNLNKSIDKFR